MTARRYALPRLPGWVGSGFALAVIGLLAGGYWFHNLQEQTVRRQVDERLLAIAQIKADRVATWRTDQWLDALLLASNSFLAQAATALANDPGGGVRLREFLLQVQREHDYADVQIVDAQGRLLFSLAGARVLEDRHSEAVATALRKGRRVLVDQLGPAGSGGPSFAVIAPLYGDGDQSEAPNAALVLINDVSRFLFPLIQGSPDEVGLAARTRLLRRDDAGQLILLNAPAATPGARVDERLPLADAVKPILPALPSAGAVIEANSIDGAPVLASLVAIPDSSWFLLYEVARDDALSGWHERSLLILTLMAALVTAVAATALVLWYRHRRAHYRGLYHTETQRRTAAERAQVILRSIEDAVIVADREGRIELLNAAAERLTGCTEDGALGRLASDLFRLVDEDTRQDLPNPIEAVLREDAAVNLAPRALLIDRNGEEKPVADTSAPIRDAAGALTGVVVVFQDQKAQRDSARRIAASELRHRTVIESAPHAIFIQAEGRFVYANPACLALLEADSPEQLLGRPVLECVAPTHYDAIRERIRRLNELREPAALAEEEFVSLKGEVIPVEVNAVPFDADGKAGAVVFMLDIRERRKAQAALAHQYAMLARTERLATIGSWEWDVFNDEVRWSDELYRIFGLPRSEPPPPFADHARLYVAEDFARLRKSVEACVASATPYELEVRVIRSDGEVRRFVAAGVPECDDLGRVQRLFGSLQDVTERRRLEDQQRHLLAAIEQAVEGFVVADPEGIIEYVNPAFEKTTGYAREEAIGQRTNFLKSGRQDDAFYRELWQTISGGQVWRGEMVNRRKDGTLYIEESSISPVFDDHGAIINYVAVKHDVSDRRRLESQFQQAQKMEAVGRLAGGVAHDFNNMLTVILGHVELAMQKLPAAEPLHADLAEIARAARRSTEVTSQLLGFARQQTISPKVMALNEMVERMLTMVRRLIGEDIDLVWRPAEDLWPVRMDPGQVNQILMNLCVNAREAIHGTGKVIIETRNVTFSEDDCAENAGFVSGDFVLLSVSDDGHGMDSETLQRVFEPFFTTKGAAEGTGLGLATTYGIVRQNNGFINVYSEPGEGATFKIYLPRCGDEAVSRESDHGPEVRRGSGEIVLLVEDDPGLLKLGRRMLENLGYTVLAAGMPEEALEIAGEQGEEIQLLVTDVIMPGMNGRILADKIQQQCPQLGVLFVSGYAADALTHRSVLDNGVTFLQKPFSLGELALKVREALERKPLSPTS